MPDIEPRPIPPTIATRSSTASSGDLIQRVAADLTPWQAVRAGKKIARRRMKTAVELARIEDETLVAQARVIAKAKVEDLEEEAELRLHKKRMASIAEAAMDHEDASEIVGLIKDEAAHGLFSAALKRTSRCYVNGVAQRSGS